MKIRLAAGALGALTIALLSLAGPSSQAASQAAVPVPKAPSASHPCGAQAKPGTYKHVIWIWFENHSSSVIVGSSQAPYFNTLAKECGLAANFHNVTHPSLPNYIAATSGLSYSGCTTSCPTARPGPAATPRPRASSARVSTARPAPAT